MNKLSLYILSIILLLFGCIKDSNVEYTSTNHSIDNSIESDSLIIKYYTPFKNKLGESLMNKPIAYSNKTYKKNDGELNSTLSNMFADATYEMSNQKFKAISNENIDIVL